MHPGTRAHPSNVLPGAAMHGGAAPVHRGAAQARGGAELLKGRSEAAAPEVNGIPKGGIRAGERSESVEASLRAGGRRETEISSISEYGKALGLLTAVTFAAWVVFPVVGHWTVALVYLLSIVFSAANLNRGPTLLVATLGPLAWNYLFISPRFSFLISKFEDEMMFATYFIVALVIGHFTTRLRESEQTERRREKHTAALYELTKSLAASNNMDAALTATVANVHESFGSATAILLRSETGVELHAASSFLPSDHESLLAREFWRPGPPHSSSPFARDGVLFLPLAAEQSIEGVLLIEIPEVLSDSRRGLLETFAAQLAIFMKKERALEEIREAQLYAESEHLQKTLFDSVSHELKTPLAAMSVALEQQNPDRAEMLQAVQRLTHTVNHLLDATRAESGMLRPNPEWCDAGELIRQALVLASAPADRVTVFIPPDLPPIWLDEGLIAQALATLISNAFIHSETAAPVEIQADLLDGAFLLSVADRGRGLPNGESQRVFDKFYRGPHSPAGGLGLGLSIAKRLVEVNGGTIAAMNREEGGALFQIKLPPGEHFELPAEHPL